MIRVTPGGPIRNITAYDLYAQVIVPSGTEVEDDCSCDSAFMLKVVDEIGTSIRKSFHWVEPDVPIYLYMDNAGGHGSKKCKREYKKKLRDKYNVLIIWQIAQSPETNMLDLGVWMSFQSLVERLHQFSIMEADHLHLSVKKAWMIYSGFVKLNEVHERWKEVMALIIQDKGGNELVDKYRNSEDRKKYLPPIMAAIEMEEDLDSVCDIEDEVDCKLDDIDDEV